eukprot:3538296-Rhodomonas_salina.1
MPTCIRHEGDTADSRLRSWVCFCPQASVDRSTPTSPWPALAAAAPTVTASEACSRDADSLAQVGCVLEALQAEVRHLIPQSPHSVLVRTAF